MKTRLAMARVVVLACSGGANRDIANRDWKLVLLGDTSDPVGTEGKSLSLRFDSATLRAGGFAGCNSYSASYELGAGRLTFGPAISTKMFCESSQEVEDAYLKALESVATWELRDGALTLRSDRGSVLLFR